MKHLYFTVTNDLSYDQRMHRICHSLASNGFNITLVGRKLHSSKPLENKPYKQKRITCFFNKGFQFYAEYNIRLFFYLLSQKMDGICAIDLDTIVPCLFASKFKSIPRIYDAHEYFTELKEVRTRPLVKKVWTGIERYCLPKYKFGYTVSYSITEDFNQRFNHSYSTIRNVPVLKPLQDTYKAAEKTLFFGGTVNEARGFEHLIPALKHLPYQLIVAGDGNFMAQLKALIQVNGVEEKVLLKGMVAPMELHELASKATLGISLVEKEGLNQYYSLTNKFFDYAHAGLPQLTMNFPEYVRVNQEFKIAVLIDELSTETIQKAIEDVMQDDALLAELRLNCLKMRNEHNWQKEEEKLIAFYQAIFN